MGALILDSRPLRTPLEPLRPAAGIRTGTPDDLPSADPCGGDDPHRPAGTARPADVQGGACRGPSSWPQPAGGGRGRRVGLYAGEVGTGHHPRLHPPDGFSPAACERFRIALVDTARSLPNRPAMPSCGLARGGSNRPMAVTDRSMTGRAPGAPVSPGDHCRAVRALARHLRFHRRCNQSGVSAGTDYARTCPDRGGPR